MEILHVTQTPAPNLVVFPSFRRYPSCPDQRQAVPLSSCEHGSAKVYMCNSPAHTACVNLHVNVDVNVHVCGCVYIYIYMIM